MDKESRDAARSQGRSPRKPKKVGTFDGSEPVFTPAAHRKETPPTYSSNGGYKHPTELPDSVYSQISWMNGQVNRMNLSQLRMRCKELRLECNGTRETVKRRLKEYYKEQKLVSAGLIKAKARINVDYFVVIDFEATCEEKNPPDYKHEIIEFPAVLVSSEPGNARIVDIFHSYVRPVINTQLSEFCRNLTGITQATVDAARPFPDVHADFLTWMQDKHKLGVDHTFSIVTDGPFDMGRFLFLQTNHLRQPFPDYGRVWVNIRKSFMHFYKGDAYTFHNGSSSNNNNNRKAASPMRLPGLQTMLEQLGLDFEGQPHSGLDDSKNIARVLIRLVADKAVVRLNEKLILREVREGEDAVNTPKLRSVTSVPRREAEQLFEEQKAKVNNKKTKEDKSDDESEKKEEKRKSEE